MWYHTASLYVYTLILCYSSVDITVLKSAGVYELYQLCKSLQTIRYIFKHTVYHADHYCVLFCEHQRELSYRPLYTVYLAQNFVNTALVQ